MTSATAAQAQTDTTHPGGPDFSVDVPKNGYRWWYVDAFSEDHSRGLTIIAFIGSVFSPYYAWARRKGPADPYQHCSINVSLYGTGGKRWSMTERTGNTVTQSPSSFQVGPSALTWVDGSLVIDVDEWTFPIPGRLRGQIRLTPRVIINAPVDLTDDGRHSWWPIAPISDVEVDFDSPDRKWRGTGYFDTNWGQEPLEQGFRTWDWSRADFPGGKSAVLYDVTRRDGSRFSLARLFDASGRVEDFAAPSITPLPKNFWRVARATQCDDGFRPRVLSTLEDAPFYARSMVSTSLLGQPVTAMHESLDLDRFTSPVVQMMLPFKMPRRT